MSAQFEKGGLQFSDSQQRLFQLVSLREGRGSVLGVSAVIHLGGALEAGRGGRQSFFLRRHSSRSGDF